MRVRNTRFSAQRWRSSASFPAITRFFLPPLLSLCLFIFFFFFRCIIYACVYCALPGIVTDTLCIDLQVRSAGIQRAPWVTDPADFFFFTASAIALKIDFTPQHSERADCKPFREKQNGDTTRRSRYGYSLPSHVLFVFMYTDIGAFRIRIWKWPTFSVLNRSSKNRDAGDGNIFFSLKMAARPKNWSRDQPRYGAHYHNLCKSSNLHMICIIKIHIYLKNLLWPKVSRRPVSPRWPPTPVTPTAPDRSPRLTCKTLTFIIVFSATLCTQCPDSARLSVTFLKKPVSHMSCVTLVAVESCRRTRPLRRCREFPSQGRR